MVTIPTLLTERLRLRAFRPDDLDAFAAFYRSERAEWVGREDDHNRIWRRLAATFGHWRLLGHGSFAITERSGDDAPIGIVGVFGGAGRPEPEIGWIAFERAEGRGYMAEAARAVLAHARDDLGLTRVVSYIDPRNGRSVRLAERMGCTDGGVEPGFALSDDPHHAWVHDFAEAVPAERGEPTVLSDAPTLRTERLTLRGWRASDLDRMIEFYADPISDFVGGPMAPHAAWNQVAGYVGGRDMRGYGIFAVEERDSGEFVGYCGPYYPPLWPEPEIAWGLMRGRHGRGYATEAAVRALAHARDDLGWETAISAVDVGNIPSQRVAERLGAVPENERRVMGASGFDAIIFRHPSPLGAHLAAQPNAGNPPVHP